MVEFRHKIHENFMHKSSLICVGYELSSNCLGIVSDSEGSQHFAVDRQPLGSGSHCSPSLFELHSRTDSWTDSLSVTD